MRLGISIKRYREKNNLTLRAFASRVGCSYEYIRQIEDTEFTPTNINKLIPILKELNIPLEQFLSEQERNK